MSDRDLLFLFFLSLLSSFLPQGRGRKEVLEEKKGGRGE